MYLGNYIICNVLTYNFFQLVFSIILSGGKTV